MTGATDPYFEAVADRIVDLRARCKSDVDAAARSCASALSRQRRLYIFDTRRMLHREAANRSGGLVALQPITQDLEKGVFLPTFERGDVVIVCSVSGVSCRALDMALFARERGSTVIAITSLEFSNALTAEHDSGHRLHEVADITIDNCAPVGDVLIRLPGFERSLGAFSGIAGSLILGSLTTQTVNHMLQAGIEPSVYTSIHLPGGKDAVRESEHRYQSRGY